jgi:uncharacterized protein (DUF1330 family)
MVRPIHRIFHAAQESALKTYLTIAASVLAGMAIGAAAIHALHAQARPPAFVVGEIDIANEPAFDKDYVPPAAKAVIDGGGKYIVRGGRSATLYGEPPKRLAIMQFESLEKAEAAFKSKAYIDAKQLGDKYARFRIYAVEGMAQ